MHEPKCVEGYSKEIKIYISVMGITVLAVLVDVMMGAVFGVVKELFQRCAWC